MISHVVLFRPKLSLSGEERRTMVTVLTAAIDGIPQIKRFSVGRRILLNRPGYETQMAEHYEYLAIMDFESEADLRAYLDHPAHHQLGQLLFNMADAVLAYDFDCVGADRLADLLK